MAVSGTVKAGQPGRAGSLGKEAMCGTTMLSRKKLTLCSIIIVAMCVWQQRITRQCLMKSLNYQHGHFTRLPAGKSNKPIINKQTACLCLQALPDNVDGVRV